MKNRSVLEILILMLTGAVVFILIASAVTVAILEIVDPTVDTSGIVDALMSITSAILGALLGLIAGKSEATTQTLSQRPDGTKAPMLPPPSSSPS